MAPCSAACALVMVFGPPKRRRLVAAISLALAALLSAAENAAQEVGRPGFADQVSVSYVLVPVVARTRGGYARHLTEDDFRVYVDGKRVKVESFETGDAAPVSLVFLQDLSGSMANAGKIDLGRLAVARFLGLARPGDRFALVAFGDRRIRVEVPFTADPEPIRRTVNEWRPSGVTMLHDAVAWLPEIAGRIESSKRAAVLITDGADNASLIEPLTARDMVRRAELPVYVLGLGTGSPEALDRGGEKVHPHADLLNLLAFATGGRYYWVRGPEAAAAASEEIAEEMRHQYVLGFSTLAGGELRSRELRVEVDNPRLRLAFRRGYVGAAPRAILAPAR